MKTEGFDVGVLTFQKNEGCEVVARIPCSEDTTLCFPVFLHLDELPCTTLATAPMGLLHPAAYPCGTFLDDSNEDEYLLEKTLTDSLRRFHRELNKPRSAISSPNNPYGYHLISDEHGGVGSRELLDRYNRMSLEALRGYKIGNQIPDLEIARVAAQHKVELLHLVGIIVMKLTKISI